MDRRRMVAGDDCERSNLAAESFQRWIPVSAKSQQRKDFVTEEKKSELQWLEPLPFWRAMAGWIAIGSLATAVDWFIFLS